MSPRGDINKLPKWAQQYIEKLERDLQHMKDEAMKGPDDSVVFANPYSSLRRRPLGDADIEFLFGDHEKIRVQIEETRNGRKFLSLMGSWSLMVRPHASNVVEVELIDR